MNRRSLREIQVSNYVAELPLNYTFSNVLCHEHDSYSFGLYLFLRVSQISERLAATAETLLQAWVAGNQLYSFCYCG